jgi:hypothetical protein
MVTMRMSLDQLAQVDAFAATSGGNRSAAISTALRAGLAFLALLQRQTL